MEYTFYFVIPAEEMKERMRQLRHETVKGSIFISGEELCNQYITSLANDNSGREYAELVAKLADCPELIVKDTQFIIGKDNCIEFLKAIIRVREETEKCTAIFSDRELDFLKEKGAK